MFTNQKMVFFAIMSEVHAQDQLKYYQINVS